MPSACGTVPFLCAGTQEACWNRLASRKGFPVKQLLIRADDLGYSYAVNLGLVRSVAEGLVRSVGLMPNMPEAARGLSWLKDTGVDVALGQHTNLCLGTPCADPVSIPSLVDAHGQLKSSRIYRACAAESIDFVAYEDAVTEIEAQLACFRELAHREPDYFEAHAVQSPTLMRAISDVAAANGLKEQPLLLGGARGMCGSTEVTMVLESMTEGYDPAASIRSVVEGMTDGETVVFVAHPGYLDSFILATSSLTTDRAKEVDALISPELRTWLERHGDLQLVDYRDL